MRIDSALNLVVPIETSERGTVYVHSTPIRRETFKKYFLVLSRTFDALIMEGLSRATGPRVAALMLRRQAELMGMPESDVAALFAEIHRLSNAQIAGPEGWNSIPLASAAARGDLTEDEIEEAEGFLVFFICVFHILRKREHSALLAPMQSMWDTQITSLNCTDFRASLPTLTETETFAPTIAASSIPG